MSNIHALPSTLRSNAPVHTAAHTGASPGVAVQLRHLAQRFGTRQVLKDIDLDVAPGAFVAIVGRSGCGKSTLLRLLAGLDAPSQGQITIDGQTLDTRRPADQGIRLMFQDARLLPWKSVGDNVALGLSGADVPARVREALQSVGLADRIGEWPAALSGGQRQRVALARALVHRPRLLLLDEPLGALDALTRIEMQQLIERLWQTHGFTAVLVTHDVSEAVALADRVLLIEDQAVALDLHVALPRSRARSHAAFGALEDQVLQRVLRPAFARTAPAEASAETGMAGAGTGAGTDTATDVRWAT
ncbi:sulfonate transport system ATP-binding protein [Aquabacterium commune]|uniref:Sulfonate transport system ATP-binding protein n=1 Tax=Aquabacterium commune TaxID=70586 RepID=A0A4R6RMV7_9BURK|nr:ATP-binding cassette domain-containing protein [Aquabacterium commune]TDP88023.1 sulfonate transport system ATP-binding protein [Aquabacterium commune]